MAYLIIYVKNVEGEAMRELIVIAKDLDKIKNFINNYTFNNKRLSVIEQKVITAWLDKLSKELRDE